MNKVYMTTTGLNSIIECVNNNKPVQYYITEMPTGFADISVTAHNKCYFPTKEILIRELKEELDDSFVIQEIIKEEGAEDRLLSEEPIYL